MQPAPRRWPAARPTTAPRCGCSFVALERELPRGALESGDGARGRQVLGAMLGAAHERVAGVAPGVRGDGSQARRLAGVAHVVHEGPRAIERRGPQVIRLPRDYVARGVA